jgi:hypothetical protein
MILEYGPSGFTPGTTGSPGAGGTMVNANSSPAVLTGLSSSTNYDIYIRRICTSPPYSINSALVTFGTKHIYDDANTAGLLTVGAGCTGAPYNTAGATVSTNEPYPSCSGTRQSPIWFKFVAPPSGAVRISTDMGTPTLSNTKIAVYRTTNVNDYNFFNIIACDEDGGSSVGSGNMSVLYTVSLTPGTTYYIALDRSTAATTHGTFCIAVDEINASMLSANTNCTGTFQQPVSNGVTNYTGGTSLLDGNSKLMAIVSVNSGIDPSTFTNAQQNINTGPVRSSSATEYLDRNYLINSPALNAAVQFFFLNSELNTLIAADPSVNVSNLGASRQGGAVCQLNFSPANGWTNFLSQSGNGISSDGLVRWIYVTTPNFSNFYLKGALGGALPVSLISFTGYKTGNETLLKWITENEFNSAGFDVQRSLDGMNFITIGFVNSLSNGGNSSGKLSYSYTDPIQLNQNIYYRLKQKDLDNRGKYSNIILIKNADPAISFRTNVYPNPSLGAARISIESSDKSDVLITINDLAGKIILTERKQVMKGYNDYELPVTKLVPGVYFVKTTNLSNGLISVSKLIRQ